MAAPSGGWVLDTNALTTLDRVKQHLNIDSADTDFDDLLTRFINAATSKIEGFLDRKIKKRSHVEKHDGVGQDQLVVREWPIVSITELKLKDTDHTADVEPDSEEISIVFKDSSNCPGTFGHGRRRISVTYEAGYDTIPSDIEEAAIWTVEYFYDMRSDQRIGVETTSKNAETTRFLPDLPKFVKEMLEKHQRTEFPTGMPVRSV